MGIDECFELLKSKIHNFNEPKNNSEQIDCIIDELYMYIDTYGNSVPTEKNEDENIDFVESESGYFYFIDGTQKRKKHKKHKSESKKRTLK